MAPKGSYLDASQYTPKELAQLLTELSRPDKVDKLLEYHKWKSAFRVRSSDQDPSLCQLCSYLNEKGRRHYVDMEGWWVREANCKAWWSHAWSKPESWYKNGINIFKETWSKLSKQIKS